MKVVIREDLVALTMDYRAAVILNQLIYWTRRVHDFDKFIQEEYNRNPECNVAYRYGWIIKTAQDLADETMLGLSRQTIRSILKSLIEVGFIEESYLEDNKWDKSTKYRLNLVNLQESLFKLGYPLNDFTISENLQNSRMLSSQHSKVQAGHSRVNYRPSSVKNLTNNIDKKIHKEIISENSSSRDFDEKKIASDMNNIWIEEIGEVEAKHLPEFLIPSMIISYQDLFNNSLDQWRTYCRQIASSQFLMGEKKGTNFKAKLSWAIKHESYERIQSGYYTLGDRKVFSQDGSINPEEEEKIKELVNNSEKHPLWVEVCHHMIERVGGQTVKQWLLDLDIAYHSQNEVYIHASNRFVRDWVKRNLIEQIKQTLESTIDSDIQHITIDIYKTNTFGASPSPELEEEGKTPPNYLSSSIPYSRSNPSQQEGIHHG